MVQITLTSRGRIVIPIALRKKFSIKARTKIAFIDEGEYIRLQPITREYVHSLRGKYKGKGLLKALMAEKKNVQQIILQYA